MKLSEVINVYGVLAELAQVKMPAQLGYKVAKNLQKFETEFKYFEDNRVKLVGTYFKDDKVIQGKEDEVNKAFNDLLNVEVELTPLKLKLSELDTLSLTPLQMIHIENLIEE